MSWWGKVFGGAFGFMLGGPLGALLGTALGHGFDRGLQIQANFGGDDAEQIQTAFFTAVFSIMGHLAKADGRVSQDEIRAARATMAHMRLSDAQKDAAIRLFQAGKEPDFPLDDILDQFAAVCGRRRNLRQMFLEILVGSALADGGLGRSERAILERVCTRLGFGVQHLEHLLMMANAARHAWGSENAGTPAASERLCLEDAYGVLGVRSDTTDADVKRAYRRLMSQHHPDKLVSKGLPEEMMQLAKEKTQDIKAAYDMIVQARNSG